MAAPPRKERPRVKGRARRRDDGRPAAHGRLKLPARGVVWNHRAAVVVAVADERPAVVLPTLYEVKFVAPERPHLHGPESGGSRVNRRRQHVAVAVAPDVAERPFLSDKGIVVRYRPVRVNAHDLA